MAKSAAWLGSTILQNFKCRRTPIRLAYNNLFFLKTIAALAIFEY